MMELPCNYNTSNLQCHFEATINAQEFNFFIIILCMLSNKSVGGYQIDFSSFSWELMGGFLVSILG